MKRRGLWSSIVDRALVAGFTLVILGLVSVQLFGVVGMAEVFGRDGDPTPLDLQSTSGIVAPVFRADLGGTDAGAEPRSLRASLWLAPIASLRGGLGLGWLERVDTELGLPKGEERHELRLRLGGGLMAPLTPSMGVDLHAGA